MHDNLFNNSFSLCSSIKVNFVLFIKARRYVNIKHYIVMKKKCNKNWTYDVYSGYRKRPVA